MRRLSTLLLALAMTLALAACGGDDADEVTDTAADLATDLATDDLATEAQDAVDAIEGGEIDPADCEAAAEALTSVPQAMAGALTGTADTAEVRAQAQTVADLDVPAEYQDDFRVVADAYTEIADALDGVDLSAGEVPDAETQAALQELTTTLSGEEYQTAATNLGEYFADGCP